VREKVVNRMKELVKVTINSAAERLSMCTRQYQYEIYGYDFMIDNACNIWLIEINTNPCIEESSPLL
jgi:tubulin---tyrosine ligase